MEERAYYSKCNQIFFHEIQIQGGKEGRINWIGHVVTNDIT